MKVTTALATFLASTAALSVTNDVALPVPARRSEAGIDTKALIVRNDCDQINEVVSSIGTSTSLAIYTTAGGGLALSVCNILHNLGVGGIGTAGCNNIAGAVASTIAFIFTAVGTSSQPAPTQSTERDVLTLESRLSDALAQHVVQFDEVTTLPVQSSDNSMPMVDQAIVSGFRHGNTTVDLTFADFGEGNGHVHISAPANQTGGQRLAKRQHNGPGFKISYTSRLESLLNSAHQQAAS